MKEKLIQYIWQHQYFNQNQLTTSSGEDLQIIDPGIYNAHQGPDFLEAKIKINETTWVGNVEIHVKSGTWYLHRHQKDLNFNNVILHVVWQQDIIIYDQNNTPINTLVLEDRVPKLLLKKYIGLMEDEIAFIACEKLLPDVSTLIIDSWKERLLIERLQQRSEKVFFYQKENQQHWEQTLWWMMARNFGIIVNAEAFENIARSIDINLLAKHKHQIIQLEALLIGQGNLLNDATEGYQLMLKKEHEYLKRKYRLSSVPVKLMFLRMRPAAFPSVRLAQMAMLIYNNQHLFSKILDANDVETIKQLLTVTANDFWHYHYTFQSQSPYKPKTLGNDMINNIIINTIVPVLFAYGNFHKDPKFTDKAIRWIEMLPAESNKLTNAFRKIGMINQNAFDSQALIQLHNQYCKEKKCLGCAIGNAVMKSSV